MVARLEEARPDVSVDILDGVGHFPMIQAPERFLAGVHCGLPSGARRRQFSDQTLMTTSPWRTLNEPSGSADESRQAWANPSEVFAAGDRASQQLVGQR